MDQNMMEILSTGTRLVVDAPPIRDFECPFCGSSEGTMLSRDAEKVIFTCFRAKCPKNGSIMLPIVGTMIPTVPKKTFKPRVFTGQTQDLNADQIDYFKNKYQIDPLRGRIGWSEAEQRYSIPLHTYTGDRWGWGLRSFQEGIDRKFILYKEQDVETLYFCPSVDYRKSDTIVLVEDVFSAMKVSRYMPAAALLGTSLSTESRKLLRQEFNKVVIWLDYDTWLPPKHPSPYWLPKPRQMKREIELFFDKVSCICSREDPKDLPYTLLKEYIDNI